MQNNIRERREALKLNQEQLAAKSGVARTVISQLETGQRTVITSDTMLKLAKAMECSVTDIFVFS